MGPSKKVLEYFSNPRNSGTIENADVVAEVGSAKCGDVVKLYLNINEAKIITKITFQTYGCPTAIACSSMITELAKNKSIDVALKISKQDVADGLGGISPLKMHCSNLGVDALRKAIKIFLSNNAI
jgi:nitrogen fixation protein NifU and related proteins